MTDDTRVLLYRHGGLTYAIDYLPTDPTLRGSCSLDRWFDVFAPHAIDLGFDLDAMPAGLSIFEGHFTTRVGMSDVIVVAHGSYRALTAKEAEYFAKASLSMAFPGMRAESIEDEAGFLRMDPWLEELTNTEMAEIATAAVSMSSSKPN